MSSTSTLNMPQNTPIRSTGFNIGSTGNSFADNAVGGLNSLSSFAEDPMGLNAAHDAALAQQQSQNNALAGQQQLYQLGNQQIEQTTGNALGALQNYGNLGANALNSGYGQAQQTMQGAQQIAGRQLGEGYQQSPGMAFQMQQGQNALAAQNSAAGGRNSGAAQKDLLQFSQGLANQDYQQYVGNQLAQNQQQIGTAAQLGQLYAGQGQSLAGMYGNLGQQSAGIFGNQLGAQLGQNQLMGTAYSNYAGFGGAGQQAQANQNAGASSGIMSILGKII